LDASGDVMFNRVAVTKLEFLLEKGLVPIGKVQLCDELGKIVTIDEFGRVIWTNGNEAQGTPIENEMVD